MTKQNNTKEILIIALKLLVICSIVASIVAFVNAITKDKIALNEKISTAEALSGIYKCNLEYNEESKNFECLKETSSGEISSVSEISIKEKRGQIVSFYQLSLTFGILFSYFVNYCCSYSSLNWRLMLIIGVIPALILFFGNK